MLRPLSLLIFGLLMLHLNAQKDYVLWTFPTPDRIYSHPAADSNNIYFGSDDKNIYAVDIKSGKEIWSVKTKNPVRSNAVLKGNLIYIGSGNNLYVLQKKTGEPKWIFLDDNKEGSEKLDEWDYHFSGPVLDDTIVYFGSGNGTLYGFEASTGSKAIDYKTIDETPIRSVPAVYKGVVFFGDVNGRIYAYDAVKKDTLWTYRTYNDKPYPSFGNIISRMVVADPYLVFGSRNNVLNVLNIHSGKLEWSYEAKDGGWFSGDPVVEKHVLYIGGSDSHKMYAFDLKTGKLLWSFDFSFNNFSKPLIQGNNLIFAAGNAYANEGSFRGYGYVYLLDKRNGKLLNYDLLGGNLFSDPVHRDGKLFLASNDGYLYAMDMKAFLEDAIEPAQTGYGSVSIGNISPNPFAESVEISYKVHFPVAMTALIRNQFGDLVKPLMKDSKDSGEYNVTWDGKDSNGQEVPNGAYFVEMRAGKYIVSKRFFRNKK